MLLILSATRLAYRLLVLSFWNVSKLYLVCTFLSLLVGRAEWKEFQKSFSLSPYSFTPTDFKIFLTGYMISCNFKIHAILLLFPSHWRNGGQNVSVEHRISYYHLPSPLCFVTDRLQKTIDRRVRSFAYVTFSANSSHYQEIYQRVSVHIKQFTIFD